MTPSGCAVWISSSPNAPLEKQKRDFSLPPSHRASVLSHPPTWRGVFQDDPFYQAHSFFEMGFEDRGLTTLSQVAGCILRLGLLVLIGDRSPVFCLLAIAWAELKSPHFP